VAAANRIGGGETEFVRPTAPARTAASTATPIAAIAQASSHGPLSEGGLGIVAGLRGGGSVACVFAGFIES
jgi:hypothetical protein